MTSVTETPAEIAFDGKVRSLGANDAARSSFTAHVGNSLIALSADLDVLGRWPVDAPPRHRGRHAICLDRGLALISGPGDVRLADGTGRVRWSYPHLPWKGAFESGCTWFDAAGQPYAVVPDAAYRDCLVVRFILDSGQPLALRPIRAQPAGIEVIHHPDGWVGLSEGEGQDAVKAWWVRSDSQSSGEISIEVLYGGWKSLDLHRRGPDRFEDHHDTASGLRANSPAFLPQPGDSPSHRTPTGRVLDRDGFLRRRIDRCGTSGDKRVALLPSASAAGLRTWTSLKPGTSSRPTTTRGWLSLQPPFGAAG